MQRAVVPVPFTQKACQQMLFPRATLRLDAHGAQIPPSPYCDHNLLKPHKKPKPTNRPVRIELDRNTMEPGLRPKSPSPWATKRSGRGRRVRIRAHTGDCQLETSTAVGAIIRREDHASLRKAFGIVVGYGGACALKWEKGLFEWIKDVDFVRINADENFFDFDWKTRTTMMFHTDDDRQSQTCATGPRQ